MRRARRTRLWIALPGGIAINGLMLALLVLVERAPPRVEDPPIITLELERLQRQREPQRPASAPRAASSQASRPSPAVSSVAAAVGPPADLAPVVATSPDIEPAWRVDPKAVERWRILEGNPNFGWGRYYRACKGLSSEHLTDEEKDRCYGGWRDADKRMEARFGGALAKPPPSRYARDAAHQERCRAYRAKRTPGNTTSGSSLHFPGVSDGVPLSQGGCF